MKKSTLTLSLILSFITLQAQHYMGGEITYNCVQSGNIRITMTLYDLCGNTAQWGNSMTLTTTLPIGSVVITKVGETDISPVCNADTIFPHISCPNSQGTIIYGIKKLIYTSDLNFPGGVPLPNPIPSTGIRLEWNNCCRTPANNGPYMMQYNICLKTLIYPPPGISSSVCFDNSPVFLENPPMHIPSSTPYSRMISAVDPDGDSLVYDWGPLYQFSNSWIPNYHPGYSYSSPLPGPAVNSQNSPVVLDSHTGHLSLNSVTQGQFFVNQRVRSYRHGALISEVNREMNILIAAAGSANPAPTLGTLPPAVSTQFYTDSLFAGDTVRFNLTATDFGFLPNNQAQSMTIDVSSLQLGLNGTNPNTGCLKPPCATLNPPPGGSSQFGIACEMTWPLTLAHSAPVLMGGQSVYTNQYDFIFRVKDDYCPMPGEASVLYRVVVFDTISLQAPTPQCIEVLGTDVQMHWDTLIDPYHRAAMGRVMMAESLSGPYTAVDTLDHVLDNHWTGPVPNPTDKSYYFYLEYKIKAKSGYYAICSDTISTIRLYIDTPLTDGISRVRWNRPYHSKDDGSVLNYQLMRSVNGVYWVAINVSSQPGYNDQVGNQGPWYYKVQCGNELLGNTSNCTFLSNVAIYQGTMGVEEEHPANLWYPNVVSCSNSMNDQIRPMVANQGILTDWTITITDMMGRKMSLGVGQPWTPCENPSLPPGMYLCEIRYILDGREGIIRDKVLFVR